MFGEHIRKIIIVIAVYLALPQALLAADLQFSPSTASYEVGQVFNIRAEVKPDGESVNAVETEILFDSDMLDVVEVSKTGSAFSLWTTEPEFNNGAGSIKFGGGSPTPFAQTSTLVTITFKAISAGTAEVSFQGGSVLAADGLGTDVLNNLTASTYNISEAEEEPEAPPPPVISGNSPVAPVVVSVSHPDEEAWYSDDTAEFSWDIPSGIDAVRILIGDIPDSVPTVPYTPPIDTRIIDDIDDGINYFHVQFENEFGWGAITHRKVQIDTAPPQPFEVIVIPDENPSTTPSLSFAAIDETSGISRYEIVIDGEDTPVTLTPDELAALPKQAFQMPLLYDGTYLVTVRAFDMAENMTEVDVSVLLETGFVEDTGEAAAEVIVEEKPINWFAWLSLLLFFLIIFLIVIIYMQRARFLKERDYLRRETKEIREKMEKIFSVLQDELEEQISSLDSKPRLSADEKRVLASLREALEVSEAFINKEIEDVEKVLR